MRKYAQFILTIAIPAEELGDLTLEQCEAALKRGIQSIMDADPGEPCRVEVESLFLEE
jgi:hypothetical protein